MQNNGLGKDSQGLGGIGFRQLDNTEEHKLETVQKHMFNCLKRSLR